MKWNKIQQPTINGVKYRSGFEGRLAEEMAAAGHSFRYEDTVIEYIKPEQKSKYTPDFILPNGIVIEVKGRFMSSDRKKHILVKKQHPDLDIRFVFNNSKATLSKTSKTTYGMWCDKHGFLYADKHIPEEWINEQSRSNVKRV